MHFESKIIMLKFWQELEELSIGTSLLILKVLINVALQYLELTMCTLIL
jgi:hypothetical protein